MPRAETDSLAFPGVEVLFWFCGLDVMHSSVSLALENRDYIQALEDHNICRVCFVSAARHLNGVSEGTGDAWLAPLEVLPWMTQNSQGLELVLVVMDAFDLASANYPVEIIRRCVAAMYPGVDLVLILRFIADTDACWVPPNVLEAFDLVWVPSTHCGAVLPSCAPLVVVVPEICTSPTCSAPSPPSGSQPFVFMVVMNDYGLDDPRHPDAEGPLRWNAARKNLSGLLKAFCSEFRTDGSSAQRVELLVKSTRPGLEESVARFLSSLEAPESFAGRVRVVKEWFQSIGQFLRLGHCVVATSRGEGWCRPLAEALRAGIPVIGSAFGGQRDFLTEETGYPVSATLVECPFALGRGWQGRSRWGEVDLEELRRTLRRVVTHYEEALSKARVGQLRLARECSPCAVSTSIGECMIRPFLGPAFRGPYERVD